MTKLPEDVKLAIVGLQVLEEKFLNPLRRLKDVVLLCVESQNRVAEADKKFARVQEEIAEAQRQALQQVERSQARLKATSDQLSLVQAQWAKEEIAHKQTIADAERRVAELHADYAIRCQRRDQIAKEIEEETKRLEELRERIRRAQTMEP